MTVMILYWLVCAYIVLDDIGQPNDKRSFL